MAKLLPLLLLLLPLRAAAAAADGTPLVAGVVGMRAAGAAGAVLVVAALVLGSVAGTTAQQLELELLGLICRLGAAGSALPPMLPCRTNSASPGLKSPLVLVSKWAPTSLPVSVLHPPVPCSAATLLAPLLAPLVVVLLLPPLLLAVLLV
jgi:hypothetical protein